MIIGNEVRVFYLQDLVVFGGTFLFVVLELYLVSRLRDANASVDWLRYSCFCFYRATVQKLLYIAFSDSVNSSNLYSFQGSAL